MIMQLQRLLVCVDGSVASLATARYAIDLAHTMHGTLRAIYVVERDDGDGVSDARSMDQLRQSGMAIITRVVGLARAQGVEVEAAVLEGIPFEVILEDARRWKADLVLMGRTGRTGPGRALLGSEAERVLEFTDRPVLIVPATEAGPA
jgi:nucleotide-binding universal stress UspA family protein